LIAETSAKKLDSSIGCRGQKQVDCITLNSAVETSGLALKYLNLTSIHLGDRAAEERHPAALLVFGVVLAH
jgi:hypothetical protein